MQQLFRLILIICIFCSKIFINSELQSLLFYLQFILSDWKNIDFVSQSRNLYFQIAVLCFCLSDSPIVLNVLLLKIRFLVRFVLQSFNVILFDLCQFSLEPPIGLLNFPDHLHQCVFILFCPSNIIQNIT